MPVKEIHGPIISTADFAAQTLLFQKVYGLEPVCEQDLTKDDVEALWGVSGHAAKTVVLNKPNTSFGIRLVAFDPGSDVIIRDPNSGYDCDALKVIDFYAPDVDVAVHHLEAAGYRLKEAVAEYDLPEGHFKEAHLWGPDHVVTATISGPPEFFKDFATVTDTIYSEPQSISGPVADPEPVISFYEQVLGLGVIFRYGIDDESFADLVGTDDEMKLRAWNIGVKTTEPYFGIIHYGIPAGTYTSLRDRSVMPNRGLVGATVITDDVDGISAAAAAFGSEILSPVTQANLLPWGPIKSLTLRAPHGIVHHIVEVG